MASKSRTSRKQFMSGMKELQGVWENRIDQHTKNGDTKPTLAGNILRPLPHLVAAGFTAFILWHAKPSSSLFSWHPTFMTLGFIVMMTEAVLLFSPWFSLAPSTSRPKRTTYHWILQALSLACAYAGLTAITYNKYLNSYPHYTSWHGIVGIIVCCTLAIQASGGLIEMFPSLLPFPVKKVVLKRLHAFSGTLVFTGAMATVGLGVFSNWFTANVGYGVIRGVACACPALILAAVLGQFFRNYVIQIFKK